MAKLGLGLFLFFVGMGILSAQPYGCHFHDHSVVPDMVRDPLALSMMRASLERSDSVDILHYTIRLDVTDFNGTLKGHTDVMFTPKLPGLDTLTFDLAKFNVDSILFDGVKLNFAHQDPFLYVYLPEAQIVGDTASLSFYYQGSPLRDPIWGGFYFEGGYAYNLGIGISSNPPNYGRAWYPCFDNFVERATYDIHLLSSAGRKGYAIGDFISETEVGVDSFWRHYRMEQLLPTYLTNVAVSNYVSLRDTHMGFYGAVPIELLCRPNQVTSTQQTFSRLGEAIDAIESWYGPYPWSRVGYVITTAGAMEHPTNTAYPVNSLGGGAGSVRLMTHELGHHWWGNITTLREATDMWIKEGNAEYTAHLLDEYASGESEFINTVKSNHRVVLSRVHIDDGDFLQLSGIPFENIYGRHTYLKGASVIHNMRGYLGDSLFRIGQNAILQNYAYQSIDAATYRDYLTATTGVDMEPFFDAWLYKPGFSSFKIYSQSFTPSPSGYSVDFVLQQGLRAAPDYHREVPLEITVYGGVSEKYVVRVIADGPFSNHSLEVPFEPVFIAINERNLLNQARMDFQRSLGQTGNYQYPFANFSLWVQEIQDSALIRVDHHWVAPGPILDQPNLKISGTNHWVVSGVFPEDLKAQGRFFLDGTATSAFLDDDIVTTAEDSLVLLYRPFPTGPWELHPDFQIIKLPSGDLKSEIRANNLKPGEYAAARGQFMTSSNQQVSLLEQVEFYPNPVSGQQIWMRWPEGSPSLPTMIQWINATGQLVGFETLVPIGGVHQIQLPNAMKGLIFARIITADGKTVLRPLIVQY